MPGEVSAEKDSPYTEKLKRPESASKATIVTPRTVEKSSKPRCKSAKPSHTRKSSPGKRHKKKRAKDEAEKEIKYVSKEVKNKLELYMNEERRQSRFNVGGSSTTTNRMAEFDVAYKLLEYDKLERHSPRNPAVSGQSKGGRQSKSADPYNIQPNLVETSRRVTGYTEADRLSKYASEVFSSYPVEKLAQIHRYRPHPKDNKKSAELGNVLGYTGHVGAALHQQTYVDFYIREGMDSGDPRKSARLQNLPKKASPSNNSKDQASDVSLSKQSSSQDSKHPDKKSKKSKVQGSKPKPGKARKVSESTVGESNQSIQDNTSTSATTKDEYQSDTFQSSSSDDTITSETCGTKPKYKKDQDGTTQELNQKSKDSLDQTWAYYESGSMKEESESTRGRSNDSDVMDDKANTDDHVTEEDGYTYSDGENNNVEEKPVEGETSGARSDIPEEATGDNAEKEMTSQKGGWGMGGGGMGGWGMGGRIYVNKNGWANPHRQIRMLSREPIRAELWDI